MKLTERTGALACLKITVGDEDLILMRDDGKVIRMPVAEISTYGRNTQGVKLMHVDDGTRIACVVVVPHQDEDETPQEDELNAVQSISGGDEADGVSDVSLDDEDPKDAPSDEE